MRTSGPPPSANGASSHHLIWNVPAGLHPIVEVSVSFEVITPPAVDRLWFWALQVSFADRHRVLGGAHLGLQHHPQYPDNGAVCWGGYHAAESGRTGELPGGPLFGPSTLGNPNVADYHWESGRRYGLHVTRSDEGWVGTIVDSVAQTVVDVRTLYGGGDRLTSPMMWTECFADCDAPTATVRWQAPTVITESTDGVRTVHDIERVRVNYQREADGGCSTSDSVSTTDGIEQSTGTWRTTPQGAVLAVSAHGR